MTPPDVAPPGAPAVAVGAVAASLGRSRAVADAPAAVLDPAVRDQLLANGHERYTEAGDLGVLMGEAVEKSLASAGLPAGEVDRVILVSENLTVGATKVAVEDGRAAIHARFHRIGLGRAPVTALTYAGCNGSVEALQFAKLLVDAGLARNVLVVAADGVLPGAARVLPPAVAVLGDGAVAALVSTQGRPSDVAVIGDYWTAGFLEVATFRDRGDDFAATLVSLGRALASMRRRLPPRDADDVLACNNYGLSTVTMFTKVLGFEPGSAFVGNVAQHGHIGNVDILCNVADAVAAHPGAGTVYALGTAHTALSILALRPSVPGAS